MATLEEVREQRHHAARNSAAPRISDAVAGLKPVARAIIAEVPLQWEHFDLFAASGLYAVGCDLSGAVGDEASILRALNVFAKRPNDLGLSTFVLGLPTPSLATGAIGAGFRYVGGEAIHPPVNDPQDIVAYRALDLFSKLFAG